MRRKLEKLQKDLEVQLKGEWAALLDLADEEGASDYRERLANLVAAHPLPIREGEVATRLGVAEEHAALLSWALPLPWPSEKGVPLFHPARIPRPPLSREQLENLRRYLEGLPLEGPEEEALALALLALAVLALGVHRYLDGERPAPRLRVRVVYETPPLPEEEDYTEK